MNTNGQSTPNWMGGLNVEETLRKIWSAPMSGPLAGASPQLQALGNSLGQTLQSFAGLNIPQDVLSRIQSDYLNDAAALWNSTMSASMDRPTAFKDRRFASAEWTSNPVSAFQVATYLLNARVLTQLADAVQGDEKTRQRVRFAVEQWIDASAPSNFLALNPEALKKALDTKGGSIAQGVQMMLRDLQQGHVSQTDESVFEVGRNVATTEGAVVFENELFQLIEYKPLTEQVFERPMLFVPPCINKYYIMDLQPENSLIRYTVEQGHRLFVVSWRNVDQSLATKTWDDYIEDAVICAIGIVQDIGGSKTIDTLGFCVGGTILTTALGVLAARGEQPAASVTLLTTFLDFRATGILDIFIDEAAVQLREMTIGDKCPTGPGLLKGKELATTFSFLRPNDLVWNYVVGNYLKGEMPPPFDLLYWNSDSTNLPGSMYCWYLRHTYLEDKLKVPGALTVCGEKLDLSAIEAPFYFYASREDHIVPWDSSYFNNEVIKSQRRFVLGASGHIAGVINPPAKKKRCYWTNDNLPATANEWLAGATEHVGSWWPDWAAWLEQHAGKKKAAPKAYGSKKYKASEPAPGRYVKEKAPN